MELGVTVWPPTIRFVCDVVAGIPQGTGTPGKHQHIEHKLLVYISNNVCYA